MKHILWFSRITFGVIFFIFCTSQAYAVGLGLSVGLGYENWQNDINYSGDRQVSNGGFIIDTTVRRNKIFGYRLTLLREKNKSVGGKLDMHGWAATHEFTFGLVRTKSLRFWVGPQLKVSYYNKLKLNTNEEIVYASGLFVDSRLGDVWGIGLGPAVGINVNRPNKVSFSFSAAYHLVGNYNGDTDYDTTNGKHYDDLHARYYGLYLNAGIILRLNE